jgi:hypothetical protein
MELPMKTIAHSNIAKRFGATIALTVIAVLVGSMTPAAGGKHGGGGGKHGGHHGGHHQPQKPPKNPAPMPKNPGPIGPLPRPTSQPMPAPQRPDVVVTRDHRAPKTTTTSGGGIKVTSTPVVRDHRATPVVRDHRATPVVRDHRATPVATSTARPRTTTVKVAGVKVLSVKTKGKACVGSYCL